MRHSKGATKFDSDVTFKEIEFEDITRTLVGNSIDSSSALIKSFRTGIPQKFDASFILDNWPTAKSLTWDNLSSKYEDCNVTMHHWSSSKGEYETASCGEFASRIKNARDHNIDRTYSSEPNQGRLWGVMNLKEIEWAPPRLAVFSKWACMLNMVWLGLSSGTLHSDPYDTVLIQLEGEKEIVIFPQQFHDLISCKAPNSKISDPNQWPYFSNFNSDKAFEINPIMRHLPRYRTIMKPGEAVTIPYGAFHAPLALEKESISLNAFLVPLKREAQPLMRLRKYQYLLPQIGKFALDLLMYFRCAVSTLFRTRLLSRKAGPYTFY